MKKLTMMTLAAAAMAAASLPAQEAKPAAKPRVVVCLAVDQLRADYLEKCGPYFSEGGIKRLLREGAAAEECRFEYALTVTAAGHATLMTGVNPRVHGIVENGFFDREAGEHVYCVSDNAYQLVNEMGGYWYQGASPKRLLVETVGDQLEAATDGKAITFSIAAKDRSAVLMAGKKPDEVYWFDMRDGGYVSSEYYMMKTPAWLNDYQAKNLIFQWAGKQWDLTRPAEVYAKLSLRDAQEGEASWGLPNTMPKTLPAADNPRYLNYFANTPFADQYTLDIAKEGIKALGIGTDDIPDLVTISLSAFDKAGHSYGPDSYEMIDFAFRTDAMIEDFLNFMDETVGADNYVLILSADHGVAPLPEVHQEKGHAEGGRVDYDQFFGELLIDLRGKFSDSPCGAYQSNLPYLFLPPGCEGENRAQFEKEAIAYLKNLPSVADVFTREQLEAGDARPGTLLSAVQQSFHPDRSGHIFIQIAPYYMFMPKAGTTHYTPYDYDQAVPLIAYGPGFGTRGGGPVLKGATSPNWMAKIAREVLGLPEPAYASANPPAVHGGS